MSGNARRGNLRTASALQDYAPHARPGDGMRMSLAVVRALRGLIRSDARVLEIGVRCGSFVMRVTPHYLGLDDDSARVAAARAQGWDVRELAPQAALPAADETHDVALAISCDGSVEELRWALQESWRVLRPGGALLLGVPHMWFAQQPRKILSGPGASPWLGAADTYGIHAAAGWTMGALRELLARSGFAAQMVAGYDGGVLVPLRHAEPYTSEAVEQIVAARLLAVALKGEPGAPERAGLRSA